MQRRLLGFEGEVQFRERSERKKFFSDPNLLHTWGDIKQNTAQFTLF